MAKTIEMLYGPDSVVLTALTQWGELASLREKDALIWDEELYEIPVGVVWGRKVIPPQDEKLDFSLASFIRAGAVLYSPRWMPPGDYTIFRRRGKRLIEPGTQEALEFKRYDFFIVATRKHSTLAQWIRDGGNLECATFIAKSLFKANVTEATDKLLAEMSDLFYIPQNDFVEEIHKRFQAVEAWLKLHATLATPYKLSFDQNKLTSLVETLITN